MTDAPTGQLRYRAIETFDVDYPTRTIELIVTPYETPAIVRMAGRDVTEIFSAGAYDGIERRANRIRVNRDHDVTRTVGRATALHPSREVGLVAELRIAKTQLGDETLALADEGILDASAGYLPMGDGGEVWETRDRVRVTKAWLGHIAMTPDPAYRTANVLAVRSNGTGDEPEPEPGDGGGGTPNLDQVRDWITAERMQKLEAGLHNRR